MPQIKARLEVEDIGHFMSVMSQVIDEFVPEPGSATVLMTVEIDENKSEEATWKSSKS
jgi:hypothetical protein